MNTKRKLIRRKLKIKPKFHETDMMGVVHNSVYFRWFEEGHLQLIWEVMSIKDAMDIGIAFMVIENTCKYKNFVKLGDSLILQTVHKKQTVYEGKLVFEHILINEKTKAEIAVGSSSLVAVEYRTSKLISEMPKEIWQKYIELK